LTNPIKVPFHFTFAIKKVFIRLVSFEVFFLCGKWHHFLANNLATIQQSSACLLSFVTATKGFVVLTIQILATRSRVARGRQQSTSISWPFTGVTAQDCSHCNFPVINFSAKTENRKHAGGQGKTC